MDKNTIWAILLSTLVIIGFTFYQMKMVPAKQPSAQQSVSVNSDVTVESTEIASTTEDSASEGSLIVPEEKIEEAEYTIETDKLIVKFTNKGGDIISYELKDHRDGEKPVQLADNISDQNRAFSVSFGGENNSLINETFNVKIISDYAIGFFRPFSVKNSDGTTSTFTLVKQYTFLPDEYVFKLDVMIEGDGNMNGLDIGNAAYTLRTSPQIGPHFNRKKDRYENRTFMSYAGEKKKKQMLGDGQSKSFDSTFTWTGVTGKYFAVLAAPAVEGTMSRAVYSTAVEKDNYANAQVKLVRDAFTGKSVQDTYYIYAGPRTDAELSKYNNVNDNGWKVANLKFDYSMQSSGILGWLEVALKWLLKLLYKIIPNWGVAIIIMTFLLKLALFPLSMKNSLSTLKMQEIQPKIQEIQAKYKSNPEKMNAEMAKLYQEVGYNPMAGCLPLLLQWPVIIAMFNLFNNYFEFRGAMFIPGWIPDLSLGDSVYTLGFNLPVIGNEIRILPLIYLITQLLNGKIMQKINPAQGQNAASMKFMYYVFPFLIFFMFYNVPAGLLLYYNLSTIIMIVQQVIINKHVNKKKAEKAEAEAPKLVFKKRK